jgi:hypothetical protein
MQRVTLKDGTWVDLRDPEEITVRGRRGIQAIAAGLGEVLPGLQGATAETALASLGLTEEQMDAMLRIQEASIVAFVAAWSRPEPVPTIATIGDITAELFDALGEATAKLGADVASSSLDVSASAEFDPKDLSGDSEPSGGPLKDELVLTSPLT